MKRFDSSDSLGALISICPPKDHNDELEGKYSEEISNKGYSKEFQAMLDSLEQEDCGEEFAGAGKKRRLSSEQVKALERYFEVENKLEPERKAKLADELGLQPRQVAIWFQNRRARWKTKQLEKDYGLLKANYNSLKLSYDDLQQQNESLLKKVRQLKEKVVSRGESQESSESVKEESPTSENNESIDGKLDDGGPDHREFQEKVAVNVMMEPSGLSLGLNGSSSSSSSSSSNSLMTNSWLFQAMSSDQNQISASRAFPASARMCQQGNGGHGQIAMMMRSEQEAGNHIIPSPFGSSEEPNCNNFFSVDQAPTLYWYFPEQ